MSIDLCLVEELLDNGLFGVGECLSDDVVKGGIGLAEKESIVFFLCAVFLILTHGV